jgi:hypothetical protein
LAADSCRQPQTYVKPEAAITVFELLIMSVLFLVLLSEYIAIMFLNYIIKIVFITIT